jgi:hypothetical protein
MKALAVQSRLEYARATVAVLRTLKITQTTMRYIDLARSIGLMSDHDRWEPRLRQQIEDILQLVAAARLQRRDLRNGPRPFPRNGRHAVTSRMTIVRQRFRHWKTRSSRARWPKC